MKAYAAMRVHKTTLILVVLLAALALWIPQRHRLAEARLALAEAGEQRATAAGSGCMAAIDAERWLEATGDAPDDMDETPTDW